jgi:hypothetical protein
MNEGEAMHILKSGNRALTWMVSAILLALTAPELSYAAEIRGQVTDATTGAGLDAARIAYDLVPADGSEEASRVSDSYGFYAVTNLPAGTYKVSYRRGGYYPVVETNLYGAADEETAVTPLTPLPGGTGHDILVQVQCVTTTEKLGGVPVAAIRFVDPLDTIPADTSVEITDGDGFARFSGMASGHYRFQANSPTNGTPRPNWKPYSTLTDTNWPDKTWVTRSYMASFMLKPEPLQEISIRVVGFDPITEVPGPLSRFWVELTGRSTRDGAMLMPPRTGVTGPDGIVTFGRLPAIGWEAMARRPGYGSPGVGVPPDPVTGDFPADPVDLPVDLLPTELEVVLKSPYSGPMMHGLHVELKGLQGTFTEGITRMAPAGLEPGGDVKAVFMGILPGRYTLRVDEPKPSPPVTSMEFTDHSFHVHFRGSDYALATDGGTNRVELALNPVPARVRVRLYAADEMGQLDTRLSGKATERPIYHLREQTGLVFRITAASEAFISTNETTVTVDTDALGEAALTVLPGVYGVKIPGMTNYWGSEALYEVVGGTNIISVGWPYGDAWPYGGSYNALHQGAGLLFDSGADLRIDLFARRKKVDLEGVVFLDPDDPTTWQVLANPAQGDEVVLFYADMAETGGMVTMTGGTNGPVTTNMVAEPNGNFVKYTFRDVVPGMYSFSAAHVRNTFTGSGITIGEWGDYPGATPPTFPGSPLDRTPLTRIEADSTPFGPLGFPPLLADYAGSDTRTMTVYAWNQNANPVPAYELQFTTSDPQIVQPSYASNLFFATIAPTHVVPVGGFTFWRSFGEHGWYKKKGAGPYDVYLDGDDDNTAVSNAPSVTYSLTYEDRSIDDPTLLIRPVTNITATGETILSGQTNATFSGSFTPTNVVHMQWEWPSNTPYRVEILSRKPPRVRVSPLLKLGLAVSGTVSRASSTQFVSRASVRVYDRYGKVLRKTVTSTNGTYSFKSALPAAQTLFVDVNAGGYQPWRKRFGDTNILAAGTNLVVHAALLPIPPPTVTNITFDRYGLFLPGVTRSGDQSLLEGFSAKPKLKTTWTAETVPVVYTNVMPAFDQPDGTPGPMVTNVLADQVGEILLIDPRSFPEGIYNLPIDTNAPPEATAGNLTLLRWIKEVERGAFPNMFHRKAGNLPPGAGVKAAGEFQISSLPAEAFNPLFAAVTRRGVAAVKTDFAFADDTHQIRGVRMPAWLATSLNLMATVAGTQMNAEYLKTVVPTERFGMLPTFTSMISTNAGGFLFYTNQVSIDWNEGMKTPTGGMLALGPGFLGLSFKGLLHFAVDGGEAKSLLQVKAQADTDDLNRNKLLPGGAAKYLEASGTDMTVKFRAVGSTTGSRMYDRENSPLEYEVVHTVGGGFVGEITQNMTPLLKALPYAGPVLKAADASGALTISGLLTAGVGIQSETSWQTPFPPNKHGGSTVPPDPHVQVLRRHFLGGSKEEAELTMCFRFGLGASADSKLLRSGVSAQLFLEGTNCVNSGPNQVDIIGAPACDFKVNENFDWPLLTRVRGQASIEVDAYADVWVTKLEKNWKWKAFEFDHQFGSHPVFQLFPVDIGSDLLSPLTATGGVFVGIQPTMVRDFFGAGQFAAAGGSPGLFLYTDITPGGLMSIEASLASGPGTWTTPAQLTTAGGIVALDAAELPGGGWMVVWSEIDEGDVGNPFPDSRLMYTMSNPAGTTWSPPALLDTLTGSVARGIALVDADSFFGLLYLVTDEGPAGAGADLFGRTWSGAAWSGATGAGYRNDVGRWRAEAFSPASGDKVMIGELSGGGVLSTSTWDGAVFTSSAPIVTNTVSAFGMAGNPDGSMTLAISSREETSFDVYLYGEVPGLVKLDTVATVGPPRELAVAPLSTASTTLVAWAEGGDYSSLWYAFLDETAAPLQSPTNLTGNQIGRYTGLELVGRSVTNATLFARISGGGVSELRAFDLALGALDDDSDGDGLSDAEELRIVDADTGDAIVDIGGVLPGDDFDGDGMSNEGELRFGYDPTDASSVSALYMSAPDGAGAFDLVFETMDGHLYRVQRSSNLLNSTGWSDLPTVTGDGLPVSVSRSATDPNMFYRLRQTLP